MQLTTAVISHIRKSGVSRMDMCSVIIFRKNLFAFEHLSSNSKPHLSVSTCFNVPLFSFSVLSCQSVYFLFFSRTTNSFHLLLVSAQRSRLEVNRRTQTVAHLGVVYNAAVQLSLSEIVKPTLTTYLKMLGV